MASSSRKSRDTTQLAGNLQIARRYLATAQPDLVVADVILPDGEGLDLLATPPAHLAYPLMLLTAYADAEVAVWALKHGVIDYVVKSVETLTHLPQLVEAALASWQVDQPAPAQPKDFLPHLQNQLQLVSSLLQLQIDACQDVVIRHQLISSWQRIHTIALAHQPVYHTADLIQVMMRPYLEHLAYHLALADEMVARVELTVTVADLTLDPDRAIACGLIVGELVSNTFHHGFPPPSTGRLAVDLQLTAANQICLRVRDDGVGLPWGLDVGQSPGFGLQLVQLLTQQLAGSLSQLPGPGAGFEMRFPD